MKVYIPISHIKVALLMAAKNGVRNYLNGVLVEADGDKTITVATNGHVMGAACHGSPDNDCDTARVVIPREVCALAIKLPRKANFGDELNLELSFDGSRWTLGDINFKPLDGKFTDWRAMFAQYVQVEANAIPGNFNASYLALFQKASLALGSSYGGISVHHNGPEKAAIITLDAPASFIGIVMPMKLLSKPKLDIPKWALAA